jgi:CRP/FNR family transcriptional regulator, dissimilatory nitrate respiration regulator
MDSASLLETADFFKGISHGGRKALESIGVLKTFKKKEMLFMEGEQGRSVFLLATGSVQLYKSSSEGKEVVIKIVKPGEIFAEVILFERDNYPVSAIAIEESQVYLFPKRQFYSLLDHEAFRNDFIRMLMQKQRYLVDQILHLSVADVEKRFFRFLRDHYGEKEEYSVPLSKKDIAATIGTLPETLSRLILRLKNEGKLAWEGDHIRLQAGFWGEWHQRESS